MKPLLILQARISSTRLPGKIMMPINGKPMIYWQIKRIQEANIGDLIVATTNESTDDVLIEFLEANTVKFHRGSTDNVAERFCEVLNIYPAEYFFRLTGDCPLVMPELLISMNEYYRANNVDYFSNTLMPTFPDGLDIEIIRTNSFMKMFELELSKLEKEHVTQKIINSPDVFKLTNYYSTRDFSHLRWTVDYIEDFEFVSRVFTYFNGRELDFDFEDLLKAIQSGLIQDNAKSGDFRNIALRKLE